MLCIIICYLCKYSILAKAFFFRIQGGSYAVSVAQFTLIFVIVIIFDLSYSTVKVMCTFFVSLTKFICCTDTSVGGAVIKLCPLAVLMLAGSRDSLCFGVRAVFTLS